MAVFSSPLTQTACYLFHRYRTLDQAEGVDGAGPTVVEEQCREVGPGRRWKVSSVSDGTVSLLAALLSRAWTGGPLRELCA